MKPKPDFDPMFQMSRRRGYRPILVIVPFLIVVTLSGLALRAGPIPARRPVSPLLKVAPMPGGYTAVQRGVAIPRAVSVPPRDRFVIVAPAEIDPAMVVQARDDLDAAMVFDPYTGLRGSPPADPAAAVAPMVPGAAPMGVPPGYFPAPSSPAPRVIPRPR